VRKGLIGCAPCRCRNHFQIPPRDLRTSAVSHELRLLHKCDSPFKALNLLRGPRPWRNPQTRLLEFLLSTGQIIQPTNVGGDAGIGVPAGYKYRQRWGFTHLLLRDGRLRGNAGRIMLHQRLVVAPGGANDGRESSNRWAERRVGRMNGRRSFQDSGVASSRAVSNSCFELANGFVTVTPFQVKPSCRSSDRRRRQPASAAAERITESQVLN